MISFFFNRYSKMVYVMEAAGLPLVIAGIIKSFVTGAQPAQKILLLTAFAEYLFIRICATFRWYNNAAKYSGIELHFKKIMAPVSYAMPLFGITTLVLNSAIPAAITVLLFTVIAHVNVILIYFHIRDKQELPVNYYSNRQS